MCPESALRLTEHGISCNGDKCNGCKICVEFCPVGALSLESDKEVDKEGEKEAEKEGDNDEGYD